MDTDEIIIDDMKRFLAVMKEASELRYGKVKCYGTQAYKTFGVPGILMRVTDKINRMVNYYEAKMSNKEIEQSFAQSHESVRDNLIDAINYLAMGVMLLDEDFKRLQDKTTHLGTEESSTLPDFDDLAKDVFHIKPLPKFYKQFLDDGEDKDGNKQNKPFLP